MIKKYTYGSPFFTDATTLNIISSDTHELEQLYSINNDKTRINIPLNDNDIIYGLGESLHGINKRGFIYISNNSDDPHHNEDKYSLYGSHNFLLIDTGVCFTGIFIDYPATIKYDIGFTHRNLFTIDINDANYDLYLITGESSLDVIREFRALIGKSYVAPKWAFGYGQSRWGYKSATDIRNVVNEHRNNNLPIDSVYMDIDYMTDYEDFTIDEDKFPNWQDFVSEMKEKNIHLIPIIDAGIKQKSGYEIYEEGVANNYFCKDEAGNDFITAVWPGRSVLPDFMNEKVRKWFGNKYKIFTDAGIDGFWNDMNEPALFYSEKHLNEIMDGLDYVKANVHNFTMDEMWHFQGTISGMANNPDDYKSFYHNVDGKMIRHDKLHNLYGFNMTKAAAEEFKEIAPDKEVLLFSRSSYIGMHRYAGIWTGDNSSFWSHIELLIHQLPNLNMCGFMYVGADTGGFGFDTSEELLMRFMQLSMFTPLMRNHSAIGTREQEIYKFKDVASFRCMLELRYALIPYLYSSYIKAIETNTLMFTPLGIEYPSDNIARQTEDQLMVGDSIMIAPIYKANSKGRYVYLPEDMTMLRMRAYNDYDKEKLAKGHHYVNANTNEVLIFIRKEHSLSLAKPAQCVPQINEMDTIEID